MWLSNQIGCKGETNVLWIYFLATDGWELWLYISSRSDLWYGRHCDSLTSFQFRNGRIKEACLGYPFEAVLVMMRPIIYACKIGAFYCQIFSSITCFVHYCNVLYSITTLSEIQIGQMMDLTSRVFMKLQQIWHLMR